MDDFAMDDFGGTIDYSADGSWTQTYPDGSYTIGTSSGDVAAYDSTDQLINYGNTNSAATYTPPDKSFNPGLVKVGERLFDYALTKLSNGQSVYRARELTAAQAAALRARTGTGANFSGLVMPALIMGGLFLLARK